MFDWLFEGRTSVYVVLAALAVFLLLVWWQTRRRWCLIGVIAAVAMIGVYALLHRWSGESDCEQIVRKIQEMAAAVNARDLEGLSANISDQFRSPQGRDKNQFRDAIADYLKAGMVGNVRAWDIDFPDKPSRQRPPARVSFSAKAESGGRELLADCEATFDYDAEHGWRLRSLRLLKPQTTEEWPIQL